MKRLLMYAGSLVLIWLVLMLTGLGRTQEDGLDLSGKRVAVIIADGFNYHETVPTIDYLQKRNAEVVVTGLRLGATQPYNSPQTIEVTALVVNLDSEAFHGLHIPGGAPGTELLRNDGDVLQFIKELNNAGKPLGAVCSGPTVLASAFVLKDKRVTAYPTYFEELPKFGATWVTANIVEDANIITISAPEYMNSYNAALGNALVR